jgi:TolB protein
MKYFFSLFLASFLFPNIASAQATGPITGAAPKADTTKKHVLTGRMLGMSPIYDFSTHDNAAIDMSKQFPGARTLPDSCYYAGEKHLKNIKQLSFEGENAEAYLSPDDKFITFQAHGKKTGTCDQIYMMPLDGSRVKRISTGAGRTTCSYFLPGGDKILYSSTQGMYSGSCPPEPDFSKGYVWPLYKAYDIYVADTNGKVLRQITFDTLYYDAESTISPKGDRMVFTSTRSGDIDLYSMKLDGTDPKQLTHEEGYDGGAYYSPDGSEIVYRASRPTGDELTEYRDLLKQGLVKPTKLEIYVMNADGSNKRQVTHLGAASFSPYWLPDGEHIIFSSNYLDPKGRNFDLFMIDKDGTGLERITYGGGFNSFPMFTRDGKKLVFCSNRNGSHPHNTNIFVADWVE